jgi:arylsulfatase A-like enzyme
LGRGFDRYSQHSEYANPQGTVIANSGGLITDEALSWLGERETEGEGARPFFLFLHFYDVHSDYSPADEFRRRFVRPYEGALDGSTSQLLDLRDDPEDVTADDVRFLHDLYDAEIAQLDAELARLFRYLDERGLAERTLVVVTSDHGEEFLEHGSLLHGRTQYQEMLHVPLLMRGPGVAAGVTVEAPVALVDVAPTVLELCGLSFPRNVDGTSLVPYWRDPSAVPAGRPLFAEADHNNAENDVVRMVRVEQMKLCANRRSGAVELFDLSRDRAESENLATSDPERVIVLRERLEDFLSSTTAGEELDPVSEETRRMLEGLGYAGHANEPGTRRG